MSENGRIDEPRMQPLNFRVFLVDNHVRIEVTAESASFDEGMQLIQDLCVDWCVDRYRYADISKITVLRPVVVPHQVPVSEDQIDVASGISAERERDLVWPHGGDAMQRWVGGETDTRYA